jgi:hypothetical protein
VISGDAEKYMDIRTWGGGGEMRALQNACVVFRSVMLRVDDEEEEEEDAIAACFCLEKFTDNFSPHKLGWCV